MANLFNVDDVPSFLSAQGYTLQAIGGIPPLTKTTPSCTSAGPASTGNTTRTVTIP